MKVANIHYRQMEKPDRDFTHAKRAEEEYKQLSSNFPTASWCRGRAAFARSAGSAGGARVPHGALLLLAGIVGGRDARLKSLLTPIRSTVAPTTRFSCSGSPTSNHPNEARVMKDEAARAKEVKHFEDEAAAAYHDSHSLSADGPRQGRTRTPGSAASAHPQSDPESRRPEQQELESRRNMGHFSGMMMNFHRRPDVSQASKVGEPTLVAPKETNATDVSREAQRVLLGGGGSSTVNAEIAPAGAAAPAPNQPVPRSPADASAKGNAGAPDNSIPELAPTAEAQPTTQAPPSPPRRSTRRPANRLLPAVVRAAALSRPVPQARHKDRTTLNLPARARRRESCGRSELSTEFGRV